MANALQVLFAAPTEFTPEVVKKYVTRDQLTLILREIGYGATSDTLCVEYSRFLLPIEEEWVAEGMDFEHAYPALEHHPWPGAFLDLPSHDINFSSIRQWREVAIHVGCTPYLLICDRES